MLKNYINIPAIKKIAILSFVFFLLNICTSSLVSAATASATDSRSIAFYYNKTDSVRELLSYDRVVVSPDSLDKTQLKQLKQAKVEVYAYLSIGEADRTIAEIQSGLLDAAKLAENKAWDSIVMDLTHPLWQQYLKQTADQLMQQGYDGLFLDTLDSFTLTNKKLHPAQIDGLALIINDIQRKIPNLILNRGFEVINSLETAPRAVVAESLFNGYDVVSDRYFQQTEQNSTWLFNKLTELQQKNIEVIVLDYLPPTLQPRIAAAKKIQQLGFTPYIGDGLLQKPGVSLHYPAPRRVLGIYDSLVEAAKLSSCHRHFAMLIEYAGYIPECMDIRQFSEMKFRPSLYAAILFDLPSSDYEEPIIQELLAKVLFQIPVIFYKDLPSDPELLAKLGLAKNGLYSGQLQTKTPLLFPLPNANSQQFERVVTTADETKVSVSITDELNQTGAAVISAPWGGALLRPTHIQELFGERGRWVLDPFQHLLPLLNLKELPVPDVTTESGLRVITAHIDGDGFPSLAWLPNKPFAGEVIYQEILKNQTLPHTVSIVEAEIAPHGLYPKISPQLEAIAKAMFKLPNVEIASHTFSHPFFWDPNISVKEKLYGDALPVPNYALNYDREIDGSINYINNRLAPSDKKVTTFLWSGMANPTPDLIQKTEQFGVYNVNGGSTYVVNDNFSYAQVGPHIDWYETGVQVYAPLMNENLYTNLWTKNFAGYNRVTESFKLLGEPKRLKPISIYYHMYSGMYPASIGALRHIYDWAAKQQVTPLFLSEYAHRAQGLYETGIAYHLNAPTIRLRSTSIRSVRINKNRFVDAKTTGIAGVNQGPDGWYLTLGSPVADIVLNQSGQHFGAKPYLQYANAMLTDWQSSNSGMSFTLQSHVPLDAVIQNTAGCRMTSPAGNLEIKTGANQWVLSSKAAGIFVVQLRCQTEKGRPAA